MSLPVVACFFERVRCVPHTRCVGVVRLVHLPVFRPHFLREADERCTLSGGGGVLSEQGRTRLVALTYGLSVMLGWDGMR